MIAPGTILIESGAAVPLSFRLQNEPYPSAWLSLTNALGAHESEKELADTGWTFFYIAGSIRATAFGFDKQKSLHTALKRLIASVKLQDCNGLEIDEVGSHSFLGIPYMSVSAHPRRIQKGLVFCAN